MWMPKDIATWLALITLILVIPLHFFSSWAYPKLQNWWAARSRKSLQQRIDKLKAALEDTHQGRGMTITNEWVLLCAERLGSLISWSVMLLVILMIILTGSLLRSARHPFITAFIITVLIMIYKIATDFMIWRLRDIRHYMGPMAKFNLERSIEELTAKLTAREHTKSE